MRDLERTDPVTKEQALTTPSAQDHGNRRPGHRRFVGRFLERYGLLLVLLVMISIFSSIMPSTFATRSTLVGIVSTVAVSMILALGLTLPLSAGDFDLSVAATLGFSAAIVGRLTMVFDGALLPATVVALAAGAFIGLLNSLLVVRIGVNALIATLGTATVLQGLTLAVLNSQTLFVGSPALGTFIGKQIVGVPLPAFYALGLAFVLWYFLEHTPTGRNIYMTGEGRTAARLSGVPVQRVRMTAFVIAGFLSGAAGIVVVGQLGAANPVVGPAFLLPAFAAAFLGSTAMKVGRFNVWGTVIAVYFVEVGVTGLQLLGAQAWVGQVFNGAVLLAAVSFARLFSEGRLGH